MLEAQARVLHFLSDLTRIESTRHFGLLVRRFRNLIEPQPLPLIRNGNMIKENMRRELITVDELRAHLREQGIEHVAEVSRATIESDGRISVVKMNKSNA